jgi:hypothetical protein
MNRAKEGLRVAEDVVRFILNNRIATARLKDIRHSLSDLCCPQLKCRLLKARNASGDVGMKMFTGELKRKGTRDIFLANIQRAKESIRVLEEFSKLNNTALAKKFKHLRYRLYDVEADMVKSL